MNRAEARDLARQLMDENGLQEWSFHFDHARRRAGACAHATHTISLSGPLVDMYALEDVRGVILHEVAHALVGPAHQHDAAWRRQARRLGAPDSARLSADLPSPEARWIGTCRRCGAQRKLFSAPRRVVSCGVCAKEFRSDLILEWTQDGRPTMPGGAYARELRRLGLGQLSRRQAATS